MALTARSQDLDLGELSQSAAHSGEADMVRWSIQRMLAVAAILSVGLWTPIVYVAAKLVG